MATACVQKVDAGFRRLGQHEPPADRHFKLADSDVAEVFGCGKGIVKLGTNNFCQPSICAK